MQVGRLGKFIQVYQEKTRNVGDEIGHLVLDGARVKKVIVTLVDVMRRC